MKIRADLDRLSDCRADARRLLKELRSTDPVRSQAAAERFLGLGSFSEHRAQDVLDARERLRLKHALAVVATENEFDSWKALKDALEGQGAGDESWYARGMGFFLNRWFASYEQALASLGEEGGYLLPYRRQYFLCQADAIRLLGLDPDDPDWERIGWNCVVPADDEAFRRLIERSRANP